VVTFLRPTPLDLHTCAAIVADFGEASGLRTNLAKCSLHPIRCSSDQVELAHGILGCEVAALPFKYLGLPLVIRKVTAAPSAGGGQCGQTTAAVVCQAPEPRGGTILVQTTLSAMVVHALMSLDVLPEMVYAFTKVCRSFLWKVDVR
jgi:hypothetical protein